MFRAAAAGSKIQLRLTGLQFPSSWHSDTLPKSCYAKELVIICLLFSDNTLHDIIIPSNALVENDGLPAGGAIQQLNHSIIH